MLKIHKVSPIDQSGILVDSSPVSSPLTALTSAMFMPRNFVWLEALWAITAVTASWKKAFRKAMGGAKVTLS